MTQRTRFTQRYVFVLLKSLLYCNLICLRTQNCNTDVKTLTFLLCFDSRTADSNPSRWSAFTTIPNTLRYRKKYDNIIMSRAYWNFLICYEKNHFNIKIRQIRDSRKTNYTKPRITIPMQRNHKCERKTK